MRKDARLAVAAAWAAALMFGMSLGFVYFRLSSAFPPGLIPAPSEESRPGQIQTGASAGDKSSPTKEQDREARVLLRARNPSIPEPVVGPGARLVMRVLSDAGQVVGTFDDRIDPELVGLGFSEFHARRPEWSIEEFSPSSVVVSTAKRIPGNLEALPESVTGRIGVADDRVVIFLDRGPGKVSRATSVENTWIPLSRLPGFQQENLRQGIPFQSRSQLLMVLEGLNPS